ncbi:ureidoglycolate lyase [Comamonadaceae bacterium PP-2]
MSCDSTRPRILTPVALSPENFKPYGDVIQTAGKGFHYINNRQVARYHDLAEVDTLEEGGKPGISLFVAQPYAYPMRIAEMERHPLSSQAFIPLHDRPFLIVVAEPADTVRPEALRAFISDGTQGVNYHRAVWHHMLLAMDEPATFVVVDRIGSGPNCDICAMNDGEETVMLTLPD